MDRNTLMAIVAGCIAAVALVVGPTYVIVSNSTERLQSCVESGGSYLKVPETTTMECRQ